jgi:hypothetical protein
MEAIMTKKSKIQIYRCVVERLEVDGSIWHIHIFNIKNQLFFPTLYTKKSTSFERVQAW